MKKIIPFLVPLALLAGFLFLSFQKLNIGKTPHMVMLERAAPELRLPSLEGTEELNLSRYGGQMLLINFFASWCVPCVAEHAFLKTLSAISVPIIGIAYKDKQDTARAFLVRHGNPYKEVGLDANGEGAIAWGITGVPETFLVGQSGNILVHHAGPLTKEIWERDFTPHLNAPPASAKLPTRKIEDRP